MTAPAVVEAFTSELHPHADSGPAGGQFVATAGSAGKGKAKAKKSSGPPPGSMAYNRMRNRGTGYGIPGGDRRVRALQTILNRLGIHDLHSRPLAVDGRLGPKTTSAVVALQQRLGFKADGIVTPAFLAQIRNLRAVPKPKKAGKAAKKAAPKKATSAREATEWWDIDPIGPLDEATEALIVALHQIAPCRTTEALSGTAFNDAHRRGSDGKFIKMIDRIIDAIDKHRRGDGNGDPLKEFTRPQLRNAAKARGITLTRGESDDSIKRKLIADIGGGKKSAPTVKAPPAKKAAKAAAKVETGADRGKRVRAVGNMAAEVEELAENEADPDEIRARVRAAADRQKGGAGEADLRSLAASLEDVQDVEQMRQIARTFAESHGLTRHGEAGGHVAFNPRTMAPIGDVRLQPGDRAFVVSPGYSIESDDPVSVLAYGGKPGEKVIVPVRKAVVDEGMTSEEEAKYNAGRAPAAEPTPPTTQDRLKAAAQPGEVAGARALASVPTGLHTEGAITRLTKDQRDFLRQYKGTAYPNINGALRREQGDLPAHGGFDFHREAIGHIDAAMGRSKLRSDVVVHRGVKDGSAVFGPAWDHDLTGAQWTEHAYLSTSADPAVVLDPEFYRPDSGAVLRIRASKGTGALALSGADYESEILLQRGLRMKVLSDSGPGPNRVIEVGIVHDKPRGTAGAGDAGSAGSGAGTGAPGDGLSGGADVPGQGAVAGVAAPPYAPQTAARVNNLMLRQQAAGMRAAGIKPGKPLPRPPAEVAADLGAATSREQAHQIISALSATELRALAKEAGVTVASKANKTALRNTIVNLLVGRRLDSHAIFSGR